MERYTVLESSASLVIGILGVKLLASLFEHFNPDHPFSVFMASHIAD